MTTAPTSQRAQVAPDDSHSKALGLADALEDAAHWPFDILMRSAAEALRVGAQVAAPVAPTHTSERHFALREAHCIAAGDAFWAARPGTEGGDGGRRIAFDAGFVRGFDAGEKVYAGAPVAPECEARLRDFLAAAIQDGSLNEKIFARTVLRILDFTAPLYAGAPPVDQPLGVPAAPSGSALQPPSSVSAAILHAKDKT